VIQYILVLALMGLLAGIGIYWAVMTEHFLEWTTQSNLKLRKRLDTYFAQPVLAERSYFSYCRMAQDGTIVTFTWSLRFLGLMLSFFAIFTFSFIVSSIF
jgi:hypothetical protein